jgi:hypothetical protein
LGVATRPRSPFLRALWDALMAEAHEEAMVTVKTAMLLRAGTSRKDIADRLGIEPLDVSRACERIKRTAGHL